MLELHCFPISNTVAAFAVNPTTLKEKVSVLWARIGQGRGQKRDLTTF